MRKIVIVGLAKFHKEAQEIKEELEKREYVVMDYPKKIDDTIEQEYKDAYESFYENLKNTDDLLVLNLDKKGIEGYIGYESFAEMSYLIVKKIKNHSNQKIYIYKMPSKDVECYEEISHFINLGYIELFK